MNLKGVLNKYLRAKLLSSLLLVNIFTIVSFSFSQSDLVMEIVKVKNTAMIGNKGAVHGIKLNSLYDIISQISKTKIGTAKVLLLEKNKCGLKTLSLIEDMYPATGDFLKLQNDFAISDFVLKDSLKSGVLPPSKTLFIPERLIFRSAIGVGLIHVAPIKNSFGGIDLNINLLYNVFDKADFAGNICAEFNLSAIASDIQTGSNYNYEEQFDGSESTSSLIDINPSFEILYKGIGGLVGYRIYKGNAENSYDWWKDYTSHLAWDMNYAGYYWYQNTDLNISGFELGLTIYLSYKKANESYIIHNFKIKNLIVNNASKPLHFYSLYYALTPKYGTKGMFGFAEIGKCSEIDTKRYNFGIGYAF